MLSACGTGMIDSVLQSLKLHGAWMASQDPSMQFSFKWGSKINPKINGLKIVVTKRVSGNSVYFGTTIQREFLKAIKQCLADRVICEIETHLAQPANHFFYLQT